MNYSLERLITERQNERTRDIDRVSTVRMLELMNDEDQLIAAAVRKTIPEIGKAVDLIVARFRLGGRLFYVGAGTSGRLGILDASECPPTFGTDPGLVQGIIAGGDTAIRTAVEGAEDNEALGAEDIERCHVGANDVVVGIAASGRTPYVIGAMKHAKAAGAAVVCVCNNPNTAMGRHADVAIEAVVGPEAVLGSTRLKAGTAQKMILNMLTTTSFIQMGKVYGNLMVDMQATNVKLVNRAKQMIRMATGAPEDEVERAFHATSGHVKTATVMIATNSPYEQATTLLEQSHGFVREAIDNGLAQKRS
ncbi:N-acetylmuramic acid 6-phosphate etherase [Paenibacillus hemerocallicola]|uniref:N-acetylmuramic acid 6-phosphate etherase n=1 Tax=Paenibacillus hemerocallicola TaxID=1172614 RepID=A0A5C4T7N6_9BACL|nr:N-acetylmuramic acid 6-phosphate etherase [Paenibacillus hemerocallicola]TNJ65113.1 N-acetylmuramic acid 6-phosphate etherase [Paenibacillus hemerocallicola]